MKNVLTTALVGLFLAGTTTSCLINRSLVRFSDHADHNLTLMETRDLYGIGIPAYFYPVNVTHQFWQCNEAGSTLSCRKICDGNNDVVCPAYNPAGVR